MGKETRKGHSRRQDHIRKSNAFIQASTEALNELPIDRLVKLLEVNGKKNPEHLSIDQVVKSITEYMAYGVDKPCPECGGELIAESESYKCSQKKDNGEKCNYRSLCPPHDPFTVSEDFFDVPFLKEFKFDKFFRVFSNKKDRMNKKQDQRKREDRGRREDGYVLCVNKENEQFEKYYKGQEIVPENEFEEFMEKLREPLPSTFRVTGFGRSGKELLRSIQNDYLNKLCNITVNDKEIEPPKCLPWYPDDLAWQLDTDRNSIRHVPELLKLKQFLVSESEAGNISRQEAVSMIPPLVLDVQPQHKVLDLCAAPGSKTSQLIEFLHADERKIVPEGVVVANDVDNKRCYLMCHQVKRLQTPSFIVVNHDAAQIPGIWMNNELVKFDRVLADVPCTGDGTLRKNVDAWQKWNSAAGHNLHILQCRILKRGLDVLKTGGRLVYSTCSLNPIENEAVLSSVLSDYGGETEILDVATELPGLKFLPGKKTWKVMSRSGDWFTQMSDVPERLQTQIFQTMFPPSTEVADNLHLERCMRILPHLQDTGAFFVAVIHKIEDSKEKKHRLKMESEKCSENKEGSTVNELENINTETEVEKVAIVQVNGSSSDGNKSGKRKEQADYDNAPPLKKQKLRGYKEDPFVFLAKDDPVMDSIKLFYGLEDAFPGDQLMVRATEGKKRNLYFVSNTVKEIASGNEERIKFINMGVKLFNRSESKYCKACDYRLVQEGIEVLFPYMTKRKILVSRDDLVLLLKVDNPYITQLTKRVQEQMKALDSEGSIVYIFDPDNDDFERVEKPKCKLIITGWKGVVSARTFLPSTERAHYLRLCGVEFKTKEELQKEKAQSGSVVEDKTDTDELQKEKAQSGSVVEDKSDTDELQKEKAQSGLVVEDKSDTSIDCASDICPGGGELKQEEEMICETSSACDESNVEKNVTDVLSNTDSPTKKVATDSVENTN